jgi:hypothetical protein
MYVIPPIEVGVTLYRLDGTSQFYPSRRLLLNKLGLKCIRRAVGPRLDPSYGWRYVIRDEADKLLFVADFEQLASRKELNRSPYGCAITTVHRGGPVPGTGCRRGCNVMRRHMKTAQERRMHAFYDVEAGEPKPRASRTGFNLPSNYSDFTRSDWDNRSWKHRRKHQWKA